MIGAELEARLRSAGISASVTTAEHRLPYEREEGYFDTLTLHLPDGSISIEAVGDHCDDLWLEAVPEPAKPKEIPVLNDCRSSLPLPRS